MVIPHLINALYAHISVFPENGGGDREHGTVKLISTLTYSIFYIFACGALAASISVGIVIPSTWFVYLYKQTVSITVVVMGTKQFSD